MGKVISYRESPEFIAALDAICVATDRDRAWHLRRALTQYLRSNEWQVKPEIRSNTGHGHVYPRTDGVVARCGGPALCRGCANDLIERDGQRTTDAL